MAKAKKRLMQKWKEKRFNKIVKDIKSVKIQGARNIAKAAVKAYFLIPSKKSKKTLLGSRPTEPMMENVLDMAEAGLTKKEILNHFDKSQEAINKHVLKMIKSGDVIFTHCHSTNVSKALIHAKKKGKKFIVYNTETRPLYQGRKTAKELGKAGIKVTMFADSGFGTALTKEQDTKKATKIFLGADALTEKGVINKIGSENIARIARLEKIPFYIIADSWKFTKKKVPIEERSLNEIWDKAPKNVKIKNPSFEFVPKKYLAGIVTEFGLQKYNDFLKECNRG